MHLLGALTQAKRLLRLMSRAKGVMNRHADTAERTHTMNTDDSSTTKQTAATAPQAAHVAAEPGTSTKLASNRKGAHRAGKGAKTAAPKSSHKTAAKPPARAAANKAAAAKAEAAVPREFSKKQIVLDLLRRKNGATMGEIAKATGWQVHSIRGFISGTVGKRLKLAVESAKNDAGERIYKIAVK